MEIPLEWFVCPVTFETLKPRGDDLVSSRFVFSRDKVRGHWNFIPKDVPQLENREWKVWDQLQGNGCVSYEKDPSRNLGIGARQDYLKFKDFAKFRGRILDIGVGPQNCPTHVEYSTPESVKEFIGIDPLPGSSPKAFRFVQGLGEFLPFRNGFFDQTLFVTSLDHFLDPAAALISAARVTKKEGEICIWIGEKSKNAPAPAASPAWYSDLQIPEGADDRFHFKRFTFDEFLKIARDLGLQTKEHETVQVDEWRQNHYLKLKP